MATLRVDLGGDDLETVIYPAKLSSCDDHCAVSSWSDDHHRIKAVNLLVPQARR